MLFMIPTIFWHVACGENLSHSACSISVSTLLPWHFWHQLTVTAQFRRKRRLEYTTQSFLHDRGKEVKVVPKLYSNSLDGYSISGILGI